MHFSHLSLPAFSYNMYGTCSTLFILFTARSQWICSFQHQLDGDSEIKLLIKKQTKKKEISIGRAEKSSVILRVNKAVKKLSKKKDISKEKSGDSNQ